MKKLVKLIESHLLADGVNPRDADIFNPQNANGEDAVTAGREETRTANSDFKKEVNGVKCSKHHGKGGKTNLHQNYVAFNFSVTTKSSKRRRNGEDWFKI